MLRFIFLLVPQLLLWSVLGESIVLPFDLVRTQETSRARRMHARRRDHFCVMYRMQGEEDTSPDAQEVTVASETSACRTIGR